MNWPKIIFGAVGVGFAGWLAFVLVRFNIKRLRIIRVAATATDQQLEEIYRLVEAIGSERPNGFVLARLNRVAGDFSCIVAIPQQMRRFPWAGKSVAVQVDTDVRFRLVDDHERKADFLGREYRLVALPRIRSKIGKIRNLFVPTTYARKNEVLREKLASICPEYPTELLSYLLCVGQETFGFEPMRQGRIGTTPEWVQDPEFQYCDQCNKRMALIVQLPGRLLHKKAFQEGTFYFFGCKTHPDRTRTVAQFT